MRKLAIAALSLALVPTGADAQINAAGQKPEPNLPFTMTQVATFSLPWRIAFLPDGRMLITEKVGPVWLVTQEGAKTPVANVPAVLYQGQGGMLGVFVSPRYATDRSVYLTYSEPGDGGSSLALARAQLTIGQGTASLDGLQVVWRQMPKGGGGQFGAQIAFSPDGQYLFLTVGDRQRMTPAQDPDQALGKIVRLTLDGKPAPGNPMAGKTGAASVPLIAPPSDTEAAKTAPVLSTYTFPGPNLALAETWTTGHRTPYGMAFGPDGRLWELEHGPRGGDELNLIEPGKNYGWPLVAYATNYNQVPIPSPDTRPDLTKPVIYWTPVIAPGNLMFYKGAMFPQWQGSALLGGMATQTLNRITFDGKGGATPAERWPVGHRIRDVEVAPDGALWLLEDSKAGGLFRVTPKSQLGVPITTIADLRTRLQWAIEIEHSIIPPYLCALYSIKPGQNREAVEAITSVFIEEMLHMTLAANVLNAVGGAPVLDQPGFIPTYPQHLPHSRGTFLIPLARFSRPTIETFMRIENPEAPDAVAEADRYETQGQFYLAIEDALRALSAAEGERTVFSGDPARQITPESLDYTGSGRVIPVYDLASALAAIDEIEEQGEGVTPKDVWDGDRDMFHPEAEEVAHFFRYQEVLLGRFYQRGDTPKSGPTGRPFAIDWDAVYPMRENPRNADHAPGTPVREKMDAFNLLYSDMLRGLHRAFNGDPKHMFVTVRGMIELKARAQELMQMPSGDGVTTAGPSFEWMPPAKIAEVPKAAAAAQAFTITVQKDGPYLVAGGVPLTRKSIVYSEWHEPMSWQKDAELGARPFYKLCRCGQSKHKPYCDNTHTKVGFDGAETAPIEPTAARQDRVDAHRISVMDDGMLCTRAGFCGNRVTNIWKELEHADDSRVRFDVIQRVERCPSGRLSYDLGAGPVEPDLPRAIAVTRDGPYWVTGGIAVTMSDGRTLETRNRVELCRCGHSSNKPLCDGSHRDVKFTEG